MFCHITVTVHVSATVVIMSRTSIVLSVGKVDTGNAQCYSQVDHVPRVQLLFSQHYRLYGITFGSQFDLSPSLPYFAENVPTLFVCVLVEYDGRLRATLTSSRAVTVQYNNKGKKRKVKDKGIHIASNLYCSLKGKGGPYSRRSVDGMLISLS